MQFSEKLKKAVAKLRENRGIEKLALGVAVGICCVGMRSGNGYAAWQNTAHGMHNITNPMYNESGSIYNYIYFGEVPSDDANYDIGSQGKPIYWRVLNTTANDDNNTPALFMLTEYGISQKVWDENNDGSNDSYRTCGQIWDDYYATSSYGVDRASTVRGFLNGITSGKLSGKTYATTDYNGNGMYQNCFTAKERGAILNTVKTSETMGCYNDSSNPNISHDTSASGATMWYKANYSDEYGYAYGCPLRGDYIFLLSGSEAKNSAYGFKAAGTSRAAYSDTNRICKTSSTGDACNWWLRSGYSKNSYQVATVLTDGMGYYYDSNTSAVALRCALNINLASVIFTSLASGATEMPSPTSKLTYLPQNAPSAVAESEEDENNASRLTLYDNTRNNFSVSVNKTTVNVGDSITISYSGMPTTGLDYLSAILYSADKRVVYYGTLKEVGTLSDSGTATMTIPDYMPEGKCTLRVLNEEKELGKYTSYAGYKDITLNIKGPHVTCNITNPMYNKSGSIYNYVYFGEVPSDDANYDSGSQGAPIYWRVLNTTANDDNGTPALFVLTEWGIATKAWDENNNGSNDDYRTCGQIWDDYYATSSYGVDRASTVRGFLNGITSGKTYATTDYNGNGMYQNCFTEKERGAILNTVKTSETMGCYDDSSNPNISHDTNATGATRWYSSYYAYGCPLRGDYIFLLSGSEAKNSAYGFKAGGTRTASADTNRTCRKRGASEGSNSGWWLRSGCSSNLSQVAYVYTDGSGNSNYSFGSAGALRCALNINLASVIFTSPASGATETPSPAPTLTYLPQNAPCAGAGSEEDENNASRLTLYDNTRNNFSVSVNKTTVNVGDSITISYAGMPTTGSDYLSAILYSADKRVVYYGTLKEVGTLSDSGTATMTIPDYMPEGKCTLRVLNEEKELGKYTSYAGYKDITLNIKGPHVTCNITNPIYNVSGSSYSYLYYGKVPSGNSNYDSGSRGKPIYWRVLNTTANDGSTPALFVLTEWAIGTKAWDENFSGTTSSINSSWGQYWSYSGTNASGQESRCSTVRGFLNGISAGGISTYNGKGMYQNCFTPKERGAILNTVKTSETLGGHANYKPTDVTTSTSAPGATKWYQYSGVYYAYGSPLEGDYIFLLSASEAKNSAYGFTADVTSAAFLDTNRICRLRGASEESNSWWWLRSGSSGDYCYVALVDKEGAGAHTHSTTTSGGGALRCALNIHLASVILTSPASIAGSSSTIAQLGSIAPTAVAGSAESTSNASRLTMYDSTRDNFSVSPPIVSNKAGNNVTISYSGMPTTGSDYISAIVYNEDRSVVCYGTLKAIGTSAGSDTGTAIMTVPNIPVGRYTLRILNETKESDPATNGYTSYAGYKDIVLYVSETVISTSEDSTPPNVTNVFKNTDGTYYKLTGSDIEGSGLGIITDTSNNFLKDIFSLGTSGSANVVTDLGTTALRVYDLAGNYSTTANVQTDSTRPALDGIVTYNQGYYTFKVTDTQSGIWKITDSTGEKVLIDYST